MDFKVLHFIYLILLELPRKNISSTSQASSEVAMVVHSKSQVDPIELWFSDGGTRWSSVLSEAHLLDGINFKTMQFADFDNLSIHQITIKFGNGLGDVFGSLVLNAIGSNSTSWFSTDRIIENSIDKTDNYVLHFNRENGQSLVMSNKVDSDVAYAAAIITESLGRREVIFVLSANSSHLLPEAEGICSDGWILHHKKCYHLFTKRLTFWQARDYCKMQKATLFFPASELEQSVVSKISNFTAVWIDLTDIVTEGVYLQSDGSEASWLNWGIGEPNNYIDEDCAFLLVEGKIGWFDTICDGQSFTICETPANKSNHGCFGKDSVQVSMQVFRDEPNLTADWCISQCYTSNLKFASLMNNSDCLCGNSYKIMEKSADDHCDAKCSGNHDQLCGGEEMLSVYSTKYTIKQIVEGNNPKNGELVRSVQINSMETQVIFSQMAYINCISLSQVSNSEWIESFTFSYSTRNACEDLKPYATANLTAVVFQAEKDSTDKHQFNLEILRISCLQIKVTKYQGKPKGKIMLFGPKVVLESNYTKTIVPFIVVPVFTVLWKKNEICHCPCSALPTDSSLTEEETKQILSKKLKKLEKELTVNKKSTKKHKRRLISAPDERITAKVSGIFAIAILFVIFSMIIMGDLISFISWLSSKVVHEFNPQSGRQIQDT